MALGVGFEAVAGLGNRALLADAGEHVGQGAAAGVMIERIGGGDERCAGLRCQLGKLAQAAALVAAIGEGGGEIGAAARGGAERAQALDEGRGEVARWDDDEDLSFARGQHLLEGEVALAFDGAAVAVGQQAAQPAVGGAVGGIAHRLETASGVVGATRRAPTRTRMPCSLAAV